MAVSVDPGSGFCSSSGVYYSKREPVNLPSDPALTLPRFIFQRPDFDSSAIAYIDAETGQSISYGELRKQVQDVSAGLFKFGVKSGDVVLILCPNCIAFGIVLLAVMSIGAIVTTTNPLNNPIEISKQAADSQAGFVASLPSLLDKVVGLKLPLILMQDVDANHLKILTGQFRCIFLSELLASNKEIATPHVGRQDDTAALLYSSGTTGGYGMTETTAVGTSLVTEEEATHFGSAGLLAANTELKIVDVDSLQPLPPNKKGELWIRGPTVMRGYFGRPSETAATIDEEGWLHTGDLGYVDAEGYIYIVDRLKELIKYKGFQVAPAELEAVLLSHPDIEDAAVIPFPDNEAGQIPIAFVVKNSHGALKEANVLEFVAEQVAPFKKIRRVIFVRSIPKSSSGKILRRELASAAMSKL